MSDTYTPTTEEMRRFYVQGRGRVYFSVTLGVFPKSEEEFNRWLAQVRAEAVAEHEKKREQAGG